MPGEADPKVEVWKEKISSELSRIPGVVMLVAHSVGGSIPLRYLSEERVERPIAGLFLLATPSWNEDRRNFDDLIPRAVTRAVDSGGHQFGNNLTGIATDIRGNDAT